MSCWAEGQVDSEVFIRLDSKTTLAMMRLALRGGKLYIGGSYCAVL